jgi:phage gp36-like protein
MPAYATPADLVTHGLAGPVRDSLAEISNADQEAELESVSREFDSYFASRSAVPLTTWGVDLTAKVAHVTIFRLLTTRGYDPGREGSAISRREAAALAWLRDVSAGRAVVSGGATVATPTPAARVSTSTRRGW